ncbi:hypothetical protein [Burkholderia multivorans]|nr:hypothetical protein [Burkholderia multivorans]MBU9606823.1 hypothetical protein [Burkholderia multivorans]MBU9623846.1 hypothetical protein [Burkholderia multivorans]
MERNFPLELFADDAAGVLFGTHTSKIVFTSMQPQRDGDNIQKDVLNLVMPTGSMLQFCMYVISSLAKNEQEMAQYATEYASEWKTTLAAVKELVECEAYKKLEGSGDEEQKPTPKKRTRAKAH